MTTLNHEDPADPSVHEPQIIGAPEMVWLVYGDISGPIKHSEHVHWWKPKSVGYTICIDKAGRYSAEEAAEICARSHGVCIAVKPDGVEPLARTTPYYRLPNGTLAAMYDGGPHRPVPNSKEAWAALLRFKASISPRIERPRPIGRRATAIYLDPPPKP